MSTLRRITLVLAILSLVLTSCTLGKGSATPTLPAQSTTSPTPEETSTSRPLVLPDLPPALVETDPPIGSDLSPNASLTFYFNQPMDAGSVEAALGVDGALEWLDDATLRIIPEQPYPLGQALHITLAVSARAANGKTLTAPVEVDYQVADSLKVGERLPRPGVEDANPSSAVVATFNAPVVPLGAMEEAGDLPAAFALQPETEGHGAWINTSTYIFYPEPALAGGATYTVNLNPELTSAAGAPLDLSGLSPAEWTFSTSVPQVTEFTYTSGPGEDTRLALDGELKLSFNQPMDQRSVELNAVLLDEAWASAPLEFEWSEDGDQAIITPRGLLDYGAQYTFLLGGGAQSRGGMAIGQEFARTLRTVPALAVTSTDPAPPKTLDASYGLAYISIVTTTPVNALQDFESLVTVQPSIRTLNVQRAWDEYGLGLSGSFLPSTDYTITISASLKDKWGGTMAAPYTINISTRTPAASLSVPVLQLGAPAIFVPASEPAMAVSVTNVNQVHVERAPINRSQFVAARVGPAGRPAGISGADTTGWDVTMNNPPDRNVSAMIRLDPERRPLTPGFYWVGLSSSGSGSRVDIDNILMVVSNIQLTLKYSLTQATVWAVDLRDNTPVRGLAVRILGESFAGEYGGCLTDSEGLCTAELDGLDNTYSEVYAMAGEPGDEDFALVSSQMSMGLQSWETGLPVNYEADHSFAYLYTDRPIYRPGQMVYFKAVLSQRENGRYTPAELDELAVKIYPPADYTQSQSKAIVEMTLPVSDYGTVEGSVELPADATPGYYHFELGDGDEWGYPTNFQVAEYRKPEFDLRTEFGQPEALLGEDLHATISADYYFGAPVSDLKVHWVLYERTDWTTLPDGLQSGPASESWFYPRYPGYGLDLGAFVAEGEGVTGADGKLDVDLPASLFAGMEINGRTLLTLEATAADESNLPVSYRATASLHPSTFYIGVKPETWTAQAGQEIGFTVRALDWANQPAGQHSLTATFSAVEWERDDVAYQGGYLSYKKVLSPIASTDLQTDGQGRARVAFTPPDPGTYQIELSGEGALTQVIVWAAGTAVAVWPGLPNNNLRLEVDASEYSPGDTAVVRIPNPYPDGALALISVERSQVMRTYVWEIDESLALFELPIEEIDAPNVFISVTLLGEVEGFSDFRHGYVEVTVRPDLLKLNVDLTFDPSRAGPRDPVNINLRVTDGEGRPVRGEFSLALVDKAVLALADPNTPDIFDAFYGEQSLGVRTSLDLTAASNRDVLVELGRGGGGGDELAASPGERTEFEDTAFWEGSFTTDRDGRAVVAVTLPDNLTTWVADVRGLTSDMLVGQASGEMIATKDLLVRPVTPRFFVAGDHIQLGAIVQNNTGSDLSADVSLEAPGLSFDEPALMSQTVDVPAGGRTRVDWWVTVQNVPSIDPVFAARAGQLEDVTHTEAGDLPVLRYTASSTTGTAGVLEQSGTRLEVISLPRTFEAAGGTLTVELSPSLAATVIQSLEAMRAFPLDFSEPVISRVLANAAAYQALKGFEVGAPDLRGKLERYVRADLARLLRLQRNDGGFSYGAVFSSSSSDPRLTAYALIALEEAQRAGFSVSASAISQAQGFLGSRVRLLTETSLAADFNDQVLFAYALTLSGRTSLDLRTLYELRERLAPAQQAQLALSLEARGENDAWVSTLLSDLATTADRSASGASWQPEGSGWSTGSTPVYTTAVVVSALAQLDPASTLLTDALRYITLQRGANGCWASSYETAWVIQALTKALEGSGDMQADFAYQAELNTSLLANGVADASTGALNPVSASAPVSQLLADSPNMLEITRGPGDGRLYYTAFLEVARHAADAPAVLRGLTITRQYYDAGVACRADECVPVEEAGLGDLDGLLVMLTLTVPQTMYNVMVEDFIPAGSEVINPNLKTSRLGTDDIVDPSAPAYDLADPFRGSFGWGWFSPAIIHADSVTWMARTLTAGTYTLSYRLSPTMAGEFQVIPAHAYMLYFPDVEGRSAGNLLRVGE